MAVPNTINDFPLDCIEKLSTKQIFPKVYYSNRVEAEYLQATIGVAMLNLEQVELMQKFWYSELINMYEPFRIVLPIFGTDYTYTARLIGDLSDSWNTSIYPKVETFTIQILDNIEQIFNKNRLDVLVEVDGGEVTFIADNEVHVDWGNGIIKQYAGGSITGTPFDYVRITSLETVTSIKFQGDLIDSIDIIKGLDLTTAEDMCKDLTYMVAFTIADTPNITNTNSMFENTSNLLYPPIPIGSDSSNPLLGMDMTNVTTASRMYKGSGVIMVNMETDNVTKFDEIFMNAVRLQCIGSINTLAQTDTANMFTNTPLLVYPDASAKVTIMTGADWINEVYCPFYVTRFLQTFLYDSSNIATEFTTLTDMTTINDRLENIDYKGIGESLPLSVDDLTKSFTEIRDGSIMEFKGNFYYTTISDTDSSADTLKTYYPLVDGDNIIVVLADGTIVETTASGVTEADNIITPTMTSNITPSGLAFATNDNGAGYEAYNAFDGGTTNGWLSDTLTYPSRLGYVASEFRSVVKYAITGDGAQATRSPNTWTFEGSNDTTTGFDGTWDVLDTQTGITGWTTNEEKEFILVSEARYKSFRINITANDGYATAGVEEFKIYAPIYTLDTTAQTVGETPTNVFAVDTKVEFKFGGAFQEATASSTTYSYGANTTTESDPFDDGSLVAKYKLAGNADDLLTFNDGVATDVVWAVDDERGTVGDFRADLSKVQTPLKTSDLDATYTIAFFAKRFGYESYDDPYTEAGDYGAKWMFDGRDSQSFDSNSGGWHTNGGNARADVPTTFGWEDWNMFSYARTNGVTNTTYLNDAVHVSRVADYSSNTSSNDLQIGSAGAYKSSNFNGYISDFMLFDRELTLDEIKILYLSHLPVLSAEVTYTNFVADVPSQAMTTRVSLSHVGDTMNTLSGELYGIEDATTSTNCWINLTQLIDGWYGYNSALAITGEINPDKTSDYTTIYRYHFEGVTGKFIASFGTLGDWQLPNTNVIVYQHPVHGSVELYWDDVNKYYTGTDLPLATAIIASDVGTDSCFTSFVIPYDAVEYDFETIETEV